MKTLNMTNQQIAIVAAIAVGGFLLWRSGAAVFEAVPKVLDKTTDLVGGVLTGNNAITQNATNGAGERVAAYEGWGVLGTLGAATNAVSGGVLATAGQKMGDWLWDITH
jgi:hypothetical protein